MLSRLEGRNRPIALVVFLVLIGIGIGVFIAQRKQEPVGEPQENVVEEQATSTHRVIGHSVEGRSLEAYTFGTTGPHIVLVGGMHGGYEWNSVLLAYQFIEYLSGDPAELSSTTVTVIPALNPDGVYEVVGKDGRFTVADVPIASAYSGQGRFNAHDVDLNRNFDCKWQPTSTWRGNSVSAGTAAFSEPEAQALRDFVNTTHPDAVIFLHSQSNAVYASECENGILPATRMLMNAYASAAGYPAVDTFDAYPITGDAEGWLASIGIPAITVELSTHETTEWERNKNGFMNVVKMFEKQ